MSERSGEADLCRPLTEADVIREADKSYALGRRHGREEMTARLTMCASFLNNIIEITRDEKDPKLQMIYLRAKAALDYMKGQI